MHTSWNMSVRPSTGNRAYSRLLLAEGGPHEFSCGRRGDCRVTDDLGASLVTYALGSCIGMAIYDPVCRVGGLLHFMLPNSGIDPEKAARYPYMFADTGIPALFHLAYRLGAEKKRIRVTVAGGAQVIESELFQIGKRNQLAMRKILWKAGVLVHSAETGGEQSRTIRMEVSMGRVFMKMAAGPEQELGFVKPQNTREKICAV